MVPAAGAARTSVINDGSIALEDFFGFAVQLTGHLMNLIFLTTGTTAHAYPSALAMDFKFA